MDTARAQTIKKAAPRHPCYDRTNREDRESRTWNVTKGISMCEEGFVEKGGGGGIRQRLSGSEELERCGATLNAVLGHEHTADLSRVELQPEVEPAR